MPSENNSKVVWKVDSTHPVESEILRNALKEVIDPELGLSIVDLGLIREISINDGVINISMILTTPFCPYGPALLEMARQKAESTLNLLTKIEMGLEAWDFSMMEEGAGADWKLF